MTGEKIKTTFNLLSDRLEGLVVWNKGEHHLQALDQVLHQLWSAITTMMIQSTCQV
jgi:hypothetical protein